MNLEFREKALLPLLWIGGSFFAARCMVFDLLCPVGCAYLALMLTENRLWGAIGAAAVGILTRSGDIYITGYIAAFVLLGIINCIMNYFDLTPKPVGRALTAGLSMAAGGIIGAFTEGISLYLTLLALLQGLLSGLLTIVFYEGINAVKRGGGNELYGASLFIGCICAGMVDISVFGIPLALIALALLLPAIMGKRVLTGSDGTYLRQQAEGRLEGFAKSMERLAGSLKSVTDTIDEGADTELLKQSLKKSRSLLSEELFGVSALMRELSKELTEELALDTELGKAVKARLKSNGISCEDVLVYTRENRRYQVSIVRKCRGSCDRCVKQIIPLVSKELGVKMTRGLDMCSGDGVRCTLRLCCQRPWRISAFAAVRKRDGSSVSGDSHTFMELKYGKYMLALSDGMGSGGKAREESAASVELFEDFMEAGFQRDMALEQINSLLLMRAGREDIFATLDICNVDLYSGMAEFVKIGGMPSFIAGSDGVRLIGSGGLPVGIMDSTEKESVEVQLKSGDTIVMVTDGVTEAAPCVIGKENWLARVIDKNSSLPPEKLCEQILTEAVEADGGKIKDDMTVLAAKVWRV